MKKAVVVLLFFSSITYAQESFYASIPLGQYAVGYSDTLIFNSNQPYKQYGYEGARPVFIQMWFPIATQPTGDFLTFGDLRKRSVPDNLQQVYSELQTKTDESFISYNLSEAFSTYDEINYAPYSYEDVLSSIKEFKTRSHHSKIKGKPNTPVVVYHHGSQGFSDENFVMAEYFASRGYIVVSANYHLPYDGNIYGLLESVSDDTSTEEAVIAFAKTLSSNKNLFYIGHSWGAQVGWTFLHKPGLASAFVSEETTIEFKTDTIEIKDKWPFVYEALKTRQNKLSIPVLAIANTGEDKLFWFFERCSSGKMVFASAKEEFGHESYNATYLMRYFYREKFNQPDTTQMKRQVELFVKHLELMEVFFDSVQTSHEFDGRKFEADFFVNEP